MNAIFIRCSSAEDRSSLPYAAGVTHYVDSEVGRLRTVMLHRPGSGAEPADPAQQRLAALRRHPLGRPGAGGARRVRRGAARRAASRCSTWPTCSPRRSPSPTPAPTSTDAVLADPASGDTLRGRVRRAPRRPRPGRARRRRSPPASPTTSWRAGARRPGLRADGPARLRHRPAAQPALHPRLVSVWIGDQVAVTSLAMPARRRETTLTEAIYRHHPRFAGTELVYEPRSRARSRAATCCCSPRACVAVGVGRADHARPAPSGWPGRCFAARPRAHGARRTDRAGAGHDAPGHRLHDGRRRRRASCTRPSPTRWRPCTVTAGDGRRAPRSTAAEPFLAAAADAMGIDELRVIDTGLDPVTAEREQWDDGNNTLCIAPAARRRLRAQHRDQRPAGARRHRGRPRSPAPSWAPGGAARAACPARSPATRSEPPERPSTNARRGVAGRRADRRGARNSARRSAQRQGDLAAQQALARARRSAAVSGSVRPSASAYRLAKAATGCLHSAAAAVGARSHTGTSRPCARNMPANRCPSPSGERAGRGEPGQRVEQRLLVVGHHPAHVRLLRRPGTSTPRRRGGSRTVG